MLYLKVFFYVPEISTQMIRYNFCRFGIKENKTLNFCKFPIMLALELCDVQFLMKHRFMSTSERYHAF